VGFLEVFPKIRIIVYFLNNNYVEFSGRFIVFMSDTVSLYNIKNMLVKFTNINVKIKLKV